MKVNDHLHRQIRRSKQSKQRAQERLAFYREAFVSVADHYNEIKLSGGNVSCEGFYRRLDPREGSPDSVSASPVIPISESDYIADVELAAKCAVPSINLMEDEISDEQQEKIGKEFMRRRIFPVGAYMRPVQKKVQL